MQPNILKETVRGIQPVTIEDEMLQHREVFLTEKVCRKTAEELLKQLMYLESVFCQVLFPEKSVGIPFFQQGIFPAFSGHYASLRMRACSIR